MKTAFAQAAKVRALGPDAKALADRAFVETTVRLHRAGEGAPYTGLKTAGVDYGPAIPAAERAVASGDLRQVKAVLAEEMEHDLTRRFEAATNTAAHPAEPKTEEQVLARARANKRRTRVRDLCRGCSAGDAWPHRGPRLQVAIGTRAGG